MTDPMWKTLERIAQYPFDLPDSNDATIIKELAQSALDASIRTMTHDDFASLLAEGIHTAFRKASSHPNAHAIWKLIKELPRDEWGAVIEWVVMGITDGKAVAIEAK